MSRRVAIRAALGTVAVATVVGVACAWWGVPAVQAADEPRLHADASDASSPSVTRTRQRLVTVAGLRSDESRRGAEGSASKAPLSLASGIFYDSRGLVVTVASAVRDCDALLVRDADGNETSATLAGLDEATGIALLRVPPRTIPDLPLVAPSTDTVGAVAIAIAAESGRHPYFTRGQIRRRYERPLGSMFLLSNAVFPGYSGGPVITPGGELLGIVLGRLEEAPPDWPDAPGAGEASSFALAAADLATIVDHLEKHGRVRRGFLGVRMVQGEIVDANRPGDPFRIGVRVEEVLPDSPAAKIDLRPGDLIVGWNGETLQSPEDLMRRVEGSAPGTVVPLVWVRSEERREGRLIVGETPETNLLATPTGGAAPDPARLERRRAELQERVRALRTRAPGGTPDSTRHPRGGG